MNYCEICEQPATCKVSWPNQSPVLVCQACGQKIWDKLSSEATGTEAYLGFTVEPCED